MTGIGYNADRDQLRRPVRRMAGCWAALLLLSPAGLRGQETRQVTHYTTSGSVLRSFNAPTVVDVGLPTPVTVSPAVTGTGQGRRLTHVEVVVSQGVGGTPAQGLAGERVYRLDVDHDGNVWVSTSGRLSRFYGERWTTFDRRFVWDIEVDQQGHLWVGIYGGITRFDGQNWYRYNFPRTGYGTDLAVAPSGDVWFADRYLIYRFDGQDWWAYGHEDGIPEGEVWSIAVDKSGTVWAILYSTSYEYLIISFDGRRWVSYEVPVPGGAVVGILADSKNRVWVGEGRRLYVRQNGTWSEYDREGLRGAYRMYEDSYGRLWISAGSAFGVLDGTSWVSFRYDEFRADSVVMDDEGHLWIESDYGGVMKWDSSSLPPASPTSVASESGEGEPQSFNLFQNHPNPFNSETQIAFHLPRTERLSLEVFSLTGQSVATLMEGVYRAGRYRIAWDGRDDRGTPAGSGIFFYRLMTETLQSTRTMALVK